MKPTVLLPLLFVLAIAFSGCTGRDGATAGNVVDVTARGLVFEAPDTIRSGWTTLRLKNESGLTHFALLERLPAGIGIEQQQEQVAPVFQEGMDFLNAGEVDAAMEKFSELPEWFGQIVFLSGPGFTAAGRTSLTTVYLEPGTYLLECYVKTNGVFHSYNPSPTTYGMVHQFTVTDDSSTASEPSATLQITLSSERGIEVEGDLVPGEHTVAVHFENQKAHEHFLGHDVHLARLEDGTDLQELAIWMDWTQSTGLETPAPAEFLGGTHEMPAGGVAYFTVNLESGRYAWIAEVPDPMGKAMLTTFTVP